MKVCVCWLALLGVRSFSVEAEPLKAKVVVYGETSAGVIAAVQAARMNQDVILVCPDKHLGGLTSGGLGFTDSG